MMLDLQGIVGTTASGMAILASLLALVLQVPSCT